MHKFPGSNFSTDSLNNFFNTRKKFLKEWKTFPIWISRICCCENIILNYSHSVLMKWRICVKTFHKSPAESISISESKLKVSSNFYPSCSRCFSSERLQVFLFLFSSGMKRYIALDLPVRDGSFCLAFRESLFIICILTFFGSLPRCGPILNFFPNHHSIMKLLRWIICNKVSYNVVVEVNERENFFNVVTIVH